jgi:hypothetical protein
MRGVRRMRGSQRTHVNHVFSSLLSLIKDERPSELICNLESRRPAHAVCAQWLGYNRGVLSPQQEERPDNGHIKYCQKRLNSEIARSQVDD